MKETIKKRLSSKAVWTAIIAQVILLVTLFHPEATNTVKTVMTVIVEVATLIGVLNNPTDKEAF